MYSKKRKDKIISYLQITVPYYIPIAIAGAFVGITSTNGIFNYSVLLSFISLALLVAGFNTFNAISDYRIDKINKPYRPIPSRKITRKSAFIYSIALYTSSLLIASQLTTEFFVIVLASFILTVLYSLPKVRLKKRFLWSNLVGSVFYGVLCPLAGWSLIPTNPIPTFLIIFLFLLSFSLSITKDFEDTLGDKAFLIQTVPLELGIKNAVLLASLSIILSFTYLILLVFLEILKAEFLIVLITLPIFLYLIKKMFSKPKNVYNSIKESVVARRIFFILIVLGVLVEFLIGFVAFI